ncbi:hypothetical protein EJ110_NYTH18274 [Nymphaea thermarum]|nr:hypothetical protein EJ110_NYTH18274 [Nymphaea thermarum]
MGLSGGEDEEEERLSRMVHDFIESETAPSSLASLSRDHQDDTILSLERIVGCSTKAEKEAYESVMRYLRQSGNEGRNGLKRGLMLWLRMEGHDASLCRSAWVSSLDCPGGVYEYIDVMVSSDAAAAEQSSERLIIDTDFRSQFEIARPTAAYTQLTNILPPVFVGAEKKLSKIISLTCSAAKESLTESGLHIPPWRKTSYMKSKWLSPCQRVTTMTFPVFSRDIERPPPKASICAAPPNLMPQKRQLGFFKVAGLPKQFSTLRCPQVA